MVINRLEPTKEEAILLVKSSRKLALGVTCFCPRCGKKLLLEEFGSSYTVKCSDNVCISATSRGI